MRTVGIVAAIGLLCSPHIAVGAEPGCESSRDMGFICGIKNAEDLVSVPGTRWIIASGMADGAGLSLIDTQARQWTALRPQARHDAASFPKCPSAPTASALNTHGLNLRAGERGHSRLYVVGHGAREAIEVFDVDATGERPSLTWRGCVLEIAWRTEECMPTENDSLSLSARIYDAAIRPDQRLTLSLETVQAQVRALPARTESRNRTELVSRLLSVTLPIE